MKKIVSATLMALAMTSAYANIKTVTMQDIKAEPRWLLARPTDGLTFPVVIDANGYPVHNMVTVRVDRFAPNGVSIADPLYVTCDGVSYRVPSTATITCDTAYGMSLQVAPGEFRFGSEGTYYYNTVKSAK